MTWTWDSIKKPGSGGVWRRRSKLHPQEGTHPDEDREVQVRIKAQRIQVKIFLRWLDTRVVSMTGTNREAKLEKLAQCHTHLC